MKRTMIFGLIVSGTVLVASGCSSTPPERDYHEYSGIRASQRGAGDAVGNSLAARDGSMKSYSKAANPRPTYAPKQGDVAGVPQD